MSKKYRRLIAFDFDGVLSKNPYYKWPLDGVDFSLILEAQERGYAAAVMTCNDVGQVAAELRRHGISALADPHMLRSSWHAPRQVLVTGRKLAAHAYVDDRAIHYRFGQDTSLVWDEIDYRSGFKHCSLGHRHWGRHGAAGLLIFNVGDDEEVRFLLQERSAGVQYGGTWSTPGGAMHPGENPVNAAAREFQEELGIVPGLLAKYRTTLTSDHGGWAYHTILAESGTMFELPKTGSGSTEWESAGTRWVTMKEMEDLPLHPGFDTLLPQVSAAVMALMSLKY
jgi:8-oxo-dGTP diphosphatase